MSPIDWSDTAKPRPLQNSPLSHFSSVAETQTKIFGCFRVQYPFFSPRIPDNQTSWSPFMRSGLRRLLLLLLAMRLIRLFSFRWRSMPVLIRLWRQIGRNIALVDYLFKLTICTVLFVPAYGVLLNVLLRKLASAQLSVQTT